MSHLSRPSRGPLRRARRRREGRHSLLRNALAAAFCLVTLGGLPHPDAPPSAASAPRASYAWMFDPEPALGAATRQGWLGDPMGPAFQTASTPSIAPPPVVTLAALAPEAVRAAVEEPEPEPARLAEAAPLPPSRPADLRRLAAAESRLTRRPVARRMRDAAPAPDDDAPSFFEAVFGAARKPAGPALAYAALESDAIETPRRLLGSAPSPVAEAGTAIYDISASVVRLPSGETLEAHSGLGPHLDDPRFVHLRMRGATPPGTYDLTERERLFHGVRAIRLTPVGGSAAIHGRDGLLAHTYMLGPNGDSNGCLVFKDYNRFLQAYLSGEVRRVVVVAGRWQDAPPRFATRRVGRSGPRPGDG